MLEGVHVDELAFAQGTSFLPLCRLHIFPPPKKKRDREKNKQQADNHPWLLMLTRSYPSSTGILAAHRDVLDVRSVHLLVHQVCEPGAGGGGYAGGGPGDGEAVGFFEQV